MAAPYLGAETRFVAAPGVPQYPNGVLRLDALRGSTVVGYLVGGILATAPYPGDGTCASPRFYAVTLTPGRPTPTTRLTLTPAP